MYDNGETATLDISKLEPIDEEFLTLEVGSSICCKTVAGRFSATVEVFTMIIFITYMYILIL